MGRCSEELLLSVRQLNRRRGRYNIILKKAGRPCGEGSLFGKSDLFS